MDMSPEVFELLKDKITDNPHTIAFPHHVGSAVIKPEDQGKNKGIAVKAMQEQSAMQLQQIYKQVELLMQQAKGIQDRVRISESIYNADMSFQPVIGKTYYLYQRKNGENCLSMVAPNEWGSSMPFEAYRATVSLLADRTWNIVDSAEETL